MNDGIRPMTPPKLIPETNLYIFHLEGSIGSDRIEAGDDFLGTWMEAGFSFLFFSQPRHDTVQHLLESNPHLTLLDQFDMTYGQWLGEVFAPAQVGNFFITPPGQALAGESRHLEILLDPGLVFGTGTHPTTRHCLHALERVCRIRTPRTVLDCGTGTGLLSLAAARLGCLRVVAVDNNFLAAKTARNNVGLNGLEDRVLVIYGSAEELMDIPADLVIANIHFEVMERLLDSEGFFNKQWCILSGLLRSEAKAVTSRLARLGARVVESWTDEGIWHTFCVKLD